MKKIFIHILLLACCLGMTTCDPKFTWDDVLFTVEVQSDNAALGSVTGGGKYHYKEEITLEATPITDYEFIEWSDGVKDNPRKLVVTLDTTLTAIFQSIPQYTITVRSNDTNMGTVSGGGTYAEGSTATLAATAKNGYIFTSWSDGDRDNPRMIVVTGDVTLTALFGEIDFNGHEYVDLGLPSGTLWATCNIGAINPEEYGDYFAWGEITTKSEYSWSTYKYGSASNRLTKYCNNSSYGKDGFTDNKTVLNPTDDAATVNWGGAWRMPTTTEQQELLRACTWSWTVLNGVNGHRVTGKNGNSIFIPVAGYYENSGLRAAGTYGYFWSVSLYESEPDGAYMLFCRSTSTDGIGGWLAENDRCYGRSVRPVCSITSNENPELTTYTVTVEVDATMGSVTGAGEYEEGSTATLTATPNDGYVFASWSDGNTDNPRTIVVMEDVTLTALFEDLPKIDGHAYVDLGLPSGTLWATCNVGATNPEDYGDYIAWGETESKEDYGVYKWGIYDGSTSPNYGMTKYNESDGLITLESADDAATANWGGVWRMPTLNEQQELLMYCTWTWTTLNGVNGYRITGKNKNSIFLPAAGYYQYDTWRGSVSYLTDVGSRGLFWASSLSESASHRACAIRFNSSEHLIILNQVRCHGQSIRPVCSPQ